VGNLDWNWGFFAVYCVGLFIFGIITGAIGIPGVFPVVIGGVIGAIAGSYEWFEAHEGNNDY
jgi:hypothetical protein